MDHRLRTKKLSKKLFINPHRFIQADGIGFSLGTYSCFSSGKLASMSWQSFRWNGSSVVNIKVFCFGSTPKANVICVRRLRIDKFWGRLIMESEKKWKKNLTLLCSIYFKSLHYLARCQFAKGSKSSKYLNIFFENWHEIFSSKAFYFVYFT